MGHTLNIRINKEDFKSKLNIKDGEIGPIGPKGDSIVGPKGEKGDKGDSIVGPQGLIGKTGPKGKDGKDGEIGPQGAKGDKGDPGEDAVVQIEEIAKLIIPKIKYKDIQDAPQWKPGSVTEKGMAGTGYLREISDVAVQNVQTNQSLKWDGTKWVPYTPTDLTPYIANTFETFVQNLRTYDVVASSYSTSVATKTFNVGGGNTATVTINFSGGKPTTKVLSGTLPAGMKTICTYDFSGGRKIPLKTYS